MELVEPLGKDGPLESHIGSTRDGVYHLDYENADLDREMLRFRRKHWVALGGRAVSSSCQLPNTTSSNLLKHPAQAMVDTLQNPRE